LLSERGNITMDPRREKGEALARTARLGVLLIAAALAGAGCGKGTSGEVAADAPVPGAPAAPGSAARPAPSQNHVVGDTVSLGSGSVTVADTEADVQAGRLFNPPAGREYFAASVRGCAGKNEDGLEFRPEYFSLRLADQTAHQAGLGMKKPELIGAMMPAGGCLKGWVTFTIPEGGQPVFVTYEGSESIRWAVPPPKKPSR
jgi:hypothetical protein